MFEEITAHIYKHWKIMARRPGELAWLLVYPFVGLVSLGILSFYLKSQGAPLDTMLFVLVGVIVWSFYDVSQRAISYAITFDIWNNCLRHSFAGKCRVIHFIIGNSIFGLLSSVVAFVLVSSVSILIFGFNIFLAGFYLINLFSVFIFATGIGLLIDSLMVTRGEKWMSLIWMGTGIIMIFSGVYYPVTILPDLMQGISFALPSTHAIISMRAALTSNVSVANIEFVLGFLMSFVYLLFASLVFRWSLKRSKMSGVLTKY
jgi:ABC-2 type transport system permease protein